MKTFEKLKPQTVKQITKQATDTEEEEFIEETVQYYKVIEKKEVVEENITTLENFVEVIRLLEEKKQKLIEEIDAEIAYNQEILDWLKKL